VVDRDLRKRRVGTELRDQSLLDLAPVVADRRRPPLTVELDVAHPLLAGLAEGHVRARLRLDWDRGVATGEDLGELEFGLRAGDEPFRRPAALQPRRSELALEPLAAGGPDLRVEHRAA